jgi:hypothetical protein
MVMGWDTPRERAGIPVKTSGPRRNWENRALAWVDDRPTLQCLFHFIQVVNQNLNRAVIKPGLKESAPTLKAFLVD